MQHRMVERIHSGQLGFLTKQVGLKTGTLTVALPDFGLGGWASFSFPFGVVFQRNIAFAWRGTKLCFPSPTDFCHF